MSIKHVLIALAIVAGVADGPTRCSNPTPSIQNQDVQDLSVMAPCDDDQGHGPVHPCVTRNERGKWIVWVQGIADCPAYTVQAKDDVLCLNEAG